MSNPEIDFINRQLLDKYGKFAGLKNANYRLVWSPDQFEKRWTEYTREGFKLLNPTVKELPKYRQYIEDKWILERCLEVPEFVKSDLVEKYSYEPIWVFEDNDGNYITPIFRACEFIIENVLMKAAQVTGKKYKDPLEDLDPTAEGERERLDKLAKDLFGNETDVTDALGHREGIVVP